MRSPGSGSVTESSFSRYINGYVFLQIAAQVGDHRDDANELAV